MTPRPTSILPLVGLAAAWPLLLALAPVTTSTPQPERASLPPMVPVPAAAQTDPVPSIDDAADDPAIWVHPTNPERSLILGSDKKHGLFVYDLAGKQVQALPVGRINNVDIRYAFTPTHDLAAATNRTTRTIDFFLIDSQGQVKPAGSVPSGLDDPYGVALYHSRSGAFFAFACGKDGLVRQWRLSASPSATVTAEAVRSFAIGAQAEGMVADDLTGYIYIGEERAGIWKYAAEPVTSADPDENIIQRTLVDAVEPFGSLVADVEGLAIYRGPGQTGYLIASSQGDYSYRVYDLVPPHTLRARFTVSAAGDVGSAEETDGLEVTSAGLGARFPSGLLVVQDGKNEPRPQNFKLVRWEDIASRMTPPLATTPVPARAPLSAGSKEGAK